MVDQLNGKRFKLDLATIDNFDKYLAARGSPAEIVDMSMTTDAILDWTVIGDQYSVKVTLPAIGQETTQTFKLGQEIDQSARDGLEVTSLWTRDGNKLIETQTGEGKTFVITHDFGSAGIEHITFVAGSITATQTYKAI